jgi:hypothetical protein
MQDWVVGRNCKLYYNSGTNAVPVWVEIKRAMDVAVDGLEKNEVNVQDREDPWEAAGAGAKKASLAFGYLFKPGTDSVFTALRSSFFNDSNLEFAVMDQAITNDGAQGLRFFGQVFGFPYSQELESGQTVDVSVKRARHEEGGVLILPSWMTVSA